MSGSRGDPAVDIVIDNYNYGRFLTEAIESALEQSHRNTQVIVVDDGSTDSSREILHGYESRGVEVILKENGGQASALNAGIERCSGDVVIFLDADDVLRPQAAEAVAAAFCADPSLVKVQFRTEVIDAEGRPTGVIKPTPHLPMPGGDMRDDELVRPFDIVWMATSANAFRTESVRRIFPIPVEDFPASGADWYLVHLAALLGPVASLNGVWAGYRVHGENSYEQLHSELDLDHVRQAIEFAQPTTRALARLADELQLSYPRPILSVADLANRLISLCLAPEHHPVSGDRRRGLVRDAARAIARRGDLAVPMKLALLTWFAAMALVPRRLARRLALLFLFPERRRSINGLLGRMQGAGAVAG